MHDSPRPPFSSPNASNGGRGAGLLLDIWRDKWRLPVFLAIARSPNGRRRYGQLNAQVPDASHFMLTRALRDLEQGGLVVRDVFAEVPAKTEYALTQKGRRFLQPLLDLEVWASQHEAELLDMREKMKHPPRKRRNSKSPVSPSVKPDQPAVT